MKKSSRQRKIEVSALRKIFQQMAVHLQPHRRSLLWAGLCTLGVTLTELLRPWPLKFVFDAILIPQEGTTQWLSQYSILTGNTTILLAIISISILAIAIISGLCGFGQAYLAASVGQKVVAAIRHRLYSHIQRLSHSFHEQTATGDLLARLTGDIRMMREMLVTAVIYVCDRSLVVVGMIVIMLMMDWQLTLVSLAIIPLLSLTVGRFSREIKGATRKQRRRESEITQTMHEKLTAISVVQAFAREAYEEEAFARQNSKSMRAGLVATRMEAHMNRLVQVLLAIGTAAVIWFGVTRVQSGLLTPGDLLVFTSYLAGLYKPIRKLSSLTGRVAKATACGERIIAILDTPAEIFDSADARPAPRLRGEIEFDHVSFCYPNGHEVFRDACFVIKPGESICILGESGAGKSTLLNLLCRFYEPTSGIILIDGCDIRSYTLDSLRNQIAVVLQESVLFNSTVADNISYGKLDASDEEIIAAATAANAHDFIETLPEGYATVIGERGAGVSGGQRQRLAIARSIIQDSPIVVLDEPAANLDDVAKSELERGLIRLTANRTCLTITHDRQQANLADRILCVTDGQVIEIDRNRAELVSIDFSRLMECPQ